MLNRIVSRLFFMLIKQIERWHNGLNLLLNLLQVIQEQCAKAQGIGMGGGVDSSGENIVLRKINRSLADGLIFFDVGANRGKFTESILSVFKTKKITVHCFEPSSAAIRLLETNPVITGNAHIVLNNFALGKQQETAELYADKSGSGLASLTQRRLDHFAIDFKSIERVQIDTLDEYCRRSGVTFIDMLKIDVEGHELDVLEGSRTMFSNAAVKFCQFEFGGCNIDTRTFMQDFFYFFKQFDFEIFRITPSGYCQHLPAYKEIHEQFITTNFLAVHRSAPFTQRQ